LAKDPLGSKALGQALALATNMAAALAVGYFLGSWLDAQFGTDPWLTILCFFLGVATGMKMVYELAFGKMEKPEDIKKMMNLRENLKQLEVMRDQLRHDSKKEEMLEQLRQEEEAAQAKARSKAEADDDGNGPKP